MQEQKEGRFELSLKKKQVYSRSLVKRGLNAFWWAHVEEEAKVPMAELSASEGQNSYHGLVILSVATHPPALNGIRTVCFHLSLVLPSVFSSFYFFHFP